MADVFISYKRERQAAAEHFAGVLKGWGFSVWYDYGLIKGEDFPAQLERQIHEAKALVVLWCTLAVNSRWVKEEVYLAEKLGKLVPAMIEPCHPFGYARADTVDLTGWDGAPFSPALHPLFDALETLTGHKALADRKALAEFEAAWRRYGAPKLMDFARDTPQKQPEEPRFDIEQAKGPEPKPRPAPELPIVPAPNGSGAAHNHALEEWKHIELRTEPRVFRNFIAAHKDEPVNKAVVLWARDRLQDLEEDAFAAAGRDKAALERFLKLYPQDTLAEAARAVLAELAAEEAEAERLAEEQRRREEAGQPADAERKRRAEEDAKRIRVGAAIVYPAGLERFLPGAGKAEWFKDADFAPEMVVVPEGTFLMGAPASEPDSQDNERPQHWVTFERPFAIGRFAVTFAEWEAALRDREWRSITGRETVQPGDEGWGRGDRPVINVSWEDAKAYALWLSRKTGKDYRLPSEAEWEYACRAGTVTPFWWGGAITPEQANYNGSADPYKGGGKKGEYRQKTLPVKSFEPNPWGLYQVHGNVREWCEDLWHDNYTGAPSDGSAWTAGTSPWRVLRGGSWGFIPPGLRAGGRGGDIGFLDWDRGFRLARTV